MNNDNSESVDFLFSMWGRELPFLAPHITNPTRGLVVDLVNVKCEYE